MENYKSMQTPIVVEQFFDAAQGELWNAITNADEMKQWYFDVIPEFKAEVGFSTKFIVNAGERIFPHCWTVTQVNPGKAISYQWTFDGYPGKSISHWELTTKANKTTLRLTAEVLEPSPDNIPEFERESGVAGWNYFIKERLADYMAEKRST